MRREARVYVSTLTASLMSPQKLPVVSFKYIGRFEAVGVSGFSSRGLDGDCMVVSERKKHARLR